MEQVNKEAFEAFYKAQQDFKAAIKDSLNPHFRSKYADFASVWDAVSDALHRNGLFVMQPLRFSDGGHPIVVTIIRYKDGSVIEQSECPVISKSQNDPQAMGSAITYARRYSLASILCVVTDDDDAEAAVAPTRTQPVRFDTGFKDSIASCKDVADLNAVKKQIAAAKLQENEFKAVWAELTKKAKSLNINYNKETKQFE